MKNILQFLPRTAPAMQPPLAGEFLNIEVKFDFFAAESLATIKLDVGDPRFEDFLGR